MKYDEAESRRTERAYLSPEIVQQRARTLEIINASTGENIVDVGCGPGLLAHSLAIAVAVGPTGSVACVDSSAAMIGLAQNRCKDLPNVSYVEADVAKLTFDAVSADVITCMQLLLYVANIKNTLVEMYRVLVPGGRLYIIETDWRSTVVHSNDDNLTEKIISAWDAAVPNARLPAQLGPMLREAGFESIQTEAIPLLSTDAGSHGFAMSALKQCVVEAIAQERVSIENGKTWLSEFSDLGSDDRFFFCVNRFLFTVLKPL